MRLLAIARGGLLALVVAVMAGAPAAAQEQTSTTPKKTTSSTTTTTSPDTSYGTAILYPTITRPSSGVVATGPFTPPTSLIEPRPDAVRPARTPNTTTPTKKGSPSTSKRSTPIRTPSTPATPATSLPPRVTVAPSAPRKPTRLGFSPVFGGKPTAPREPSKSKPFVARNPIVRATGGTSSSAPPQTTKAARAPELDRPDGSAFGRTVSDVVDVVPLPVRLALAALALLVLLLGVNAVIARSRTQRLERQRSDLLDDIGLLQAALLPTVPERLGDLTATVAYRPAATLAAGGDFYDAFLLDDGRVALLLGDVSGHGREALTKTTLVRFTVRAYLEAGLAPRAALSTTGRALEGRLGDNFATVVAAIHDPAQGTLTYACAGHPPPLVLGPGWHIPVTAASSPPIGSGFPTGQRETVLPMPSGTTVCLFSDGLIDARLAGDEILGRERLASWLADLGPQATAGALVGLVVKRSDRITDDLAACIVHAGTRVHPPAFRIEHLKVDVLDDGPPRLSPFLLACGVTDADRVTATERVAAQLAASGTALVEVVLADPPSVAVLALGDEVLFAPPPAPRQPV